MLAKKILGNENPIRLLRRIADQEEDGSWTVKKADNKHRTELSRRCFSSRRLWMVLMEEEKVCAINMKENQNVIKDRIRKMKQDTKDWVMWGGGSDDDVEKDVDDQAGGNM